MCYAGRIDHHGISLARVIIRWTRKNFIHARRARRALRFILQGEGEI